MPFNIGSSTHMGVTQIQQLVSTTTDNLYAYLNGVLPQLMVFGIVIGILFFAIRWLWSAIAGHGHRP